MSKHTKGPWETSNQFLNVRGDIGISTYKIHKRENEKSCPQVLTTWEESQENARLIAAAPEMLEALELLYKEFALCPDLRADKYQHVWRAIEQAIAKATGEK
jgi:hypothetical protein